MREWCKPRRFYARDDAGVLETYRVRANGGGGGHLEGVPPGVYLVIRLDADHHILRTVMGPLAADSALHMLEEATPEKLIGVLYQATELQQSAKAAKDRQGATVH